MTHPTEAAAERLRRELNGESGAYKAFVNESRSYADNMTTCMQRRDDDRSEVVAAYLRQP